VSKRHKFSALATLIY